MIREPELDGALDALVRNELVLDPPPELQERILASVLSAAEAPAVARPLPSRPLPSLSLVAYALLALVAGLYAGLVGVLGGPEWPLEVGRAALHSATIILSSPVGWLLADLAQQLADQAVWLLLLPLVWYLWENDRSTVGQT